MSKKFVIKKSKIHGKGVFASKSLAKNERIESVIEFWLGVYPYVTTHFGKWINHSPRLSRRDTSRKTGRDSYRGKGSNTHLVYDEDEWKWYLVASRPIRKGEELLADYNHTPWYIQPPDPSWD